MIENIESLLRKAIFWRPEINEGTEFYAYIENELCQLTMNDFPDNPLYTLRWRDYSIDIDDFPEGWTFSNITND